MCAPCVRFVFYRQDVIEWLINFHNEFHGGTSMTIIQWFGTVLKAEAEWKAVCTLKGYSQSANGVTKIQKLCEEWLNINYEGRFDTMNNFNEAKATIRSLKRLGVYDAVLHLLGEMCDFANPNINNKYIVTLFHAMSVIMEKWFKGSMPADTLCIVICEMTKFMVPSAASVSKSSSTVKSKFFSDRVVPWIFKAGGADFQIQWLATPMGESVVFKKQQVAWGGPGRWLCGGCWAVGRDVGWARQGGAGQGSRG
jgi:hypothetical protein